MLTLPPQKTCASLHKDLQHRTPRDFTRLFPLYLCSLPRSRLPPLLHLARTSVDSKKTLWTITSVFDLLLPTPFTALSMMGSQTPSIAISAPSPKRDSEFLKILEESQISSQLINTVCIACLLVSFPPFFWEPHARRPQKICVPPTSKLTPSVAASCALKCPHTSSSLLKGCSHQTSAKELAP